MRPRDVRLAVEPFGSPGWREMVALRERVLRAPLGLVFTDEQLASEHDARHLALRVDEALVGTLLIVRERGVGEAVARFRQMAIDLAWQGIGLGTHLLDAGERLATSEGARSGLLHARLAARSFYERREWMVDGGLFVEVTLPHVRMTKRLRAL